jgi:hypothetical protein
MQLRYEATIFKVTTLRYDSLYDFLEKRGDCFAIVAGIVTQPDDCSLRGGIYIPHHRDLICSLGGVVLVDAQRVRPQGATVMTFTKASQDILEIRRDVQHFAVTDNTADRFIATTNVRDGFK